jgi:hypothetical protein
VVPFPARLAEVGEWAAGASNWGWLRLAAACLGAAGGAIGYWWRLRRVVAEQAPDIVQSNGIKMHLLSIFVAPRGSAVVWHVHDYVSRRPVTARALRVMAGWCAAVVANSDSVARDLQHVPGRGPHPPGVERRGPRPLRTLGPSTRSAGRPANAR